ncbi:hypothetical protein QR685DRAFT_569812 [Neurospora intermedia]|uniref:Uncharacterized protein n=1 Tax=Neurospora intermedia TaxID=5142 RepID=A0ABR3DPQ0_NEUIN
MVRRKMYRQNGGGTSPRKHTAWDGNQCVLLVGSHAAPEVIVYDPYSAHVVRVVEIPDIAHNTDYYISSVHWDFYTGLWTSLATSRRAEESGNNYVIKYDVYKNAIVWKVNLKTLTSEIGGCHGLETDFEGNTYVACTDGNTIIRILFDGQFPHTWWPEHIDPIDRAIRGLAAIPDSSRLLTHNGEGLIGALDMTMGFGQYQPDWLANTNMMIPDIQGITLPPKYQSHVCLLTSPTQGVQVVEAMGWLWQTEDYLNHRHAVQHTFTVIPPPPAIAAENGYPSDTVQVGSNSILTLFQYKDGHKNGDESVWQFEDITHSIEQDLALLLSPDGFTGWNDPIIWPDADEIRLKTDLPEGWHLSRGTE